MKSFTIILFDTKADHTQGAMVGTVHCVPGDIVIRMRGPQWLAGVVIWFGLALKGSAWDYQVWEGNPAPLWSLDVAKA